MDLYKPNSIDLYKPKSIDGWIVNEIDLSSVENKLNMEMD